MLNSGELVVRAVQGVGASRVAVCVDPPKGLDLQFIYRAALFVYWNPTKSRLEDRNESETSPLESFRRIACALADEYGMRLRLSDETRWEGVDGPTRSAMERELPS